MKVPFNNLSKLHSPLIPELTTAFQKALDESTFIGGQAVKEFETSFSSILDISRTISCGNGTDALYIALKALGCGPGKEVITTALSWISTSEAITQTGATPVFCDIKSDTFNIDPDLIGRLITEKTVGIIPVHLYGHSCDLDAIMKIANANNLWIVEDCAQAHLTTYQGRPVGSFGNLSTFSFYPGKNLGALGDAGCIVTDDNDLADWCYLYSKHGGKGIHKFEGINSRMDTLQANFLNIKLPYLKEWTSKRRSIAASYSAKLSSIPSLTTPIQHPNSVDSYHLYTIRAEKRSSLRSYLKDRNIDTLINYACPLPLLPAYSYLKPLRHNFKNAIKATEELLCLPMHPHLTDSEIDYVTTSISDFYS